MRRRNIGSSILYATTLAHHRITKKNVDQNFMPLPLNDSNFYEWAYQKKKLERYILLVDPDEYQWCLH